MPSPYTHNDTISRRFMTLAAFFGAWLRRSMKGMGNVAWLIWLLVKQSLYLKRDHVGVIYEQSRLQIKFTALDALPLVLLTSLLLGGVTLIQVFGQMSAFGAESYMSQLLARLVIRELGPLFVAIIVIGRSGTAIAAEMASIRLSGEVDTLTALGINPFHYILLPRLLGGIVSVFCLIVIFDAAALVGGFLVAWSRMPINPRAFLDALGEAIGGRELLSTLAKALIYGSLIPLICASQGLRVRRSSTEIPQAVTRSAVGSLVAIILGGAFLSFLIYA